MFSSILYRVTIVITIIGCLLSVTRAVTLTPEQKAVYDQVYTTGVQAYLWGYPVFLFEKYELSSTSVVPVNYYSYSKKLSDSTSRAVVLPNVDTIYGTALIQLKEPVVVQLPDTFRRYYSAAFLDVYSENIKIVGYKNTGTGAQTWTVVPSKWKGSLPAELKKRKISTTAEDLLLLVRIVAYNTSDTANVLALHSKIIVRNLTNYLAGKTTALPSPLPPSPVTPAPSTYSPALKNFFYISQGVGRNPPPASNVGLLDLFKQIGTVFNGSTNSSSAIALQALEDAAVAAENIAGTIPPGYGVSFNYWSYLSGIGNYGNNFSIRAYIAKVGYLALPPSEAVYFTVRVDSTGQRFRGENKYRLTFRAPPVKAFWSLTLYNATDLFLSTGVSKYVVNDRTPKLKYNSDKTLTVYIQSSSPGATLEPNWLPSVAGTPFLLVVRAYSAKPELFSSTYTLPAVQKVN